MMERLKKRFWDRYTNALIELERRKQIKEEHRKKKQQSYKRGSISYGLAMKQSPVDVYHAVIEKRRFEREQKKKT
jgi:hypothetical protein